MNFFAQQERARNKTAWLVGGLVAAVISLITITTLAVAAFLYVTRSGSNTYSASQALATDAQSHLRAVLTPELAGSVAIVVLVVVVLASLFKLLQLSGGGKEVALSLGGRPINTDTRDADERKVLNVVEEMAIASGNPVPEVYVLEDSAINAFAAGFNRQDAVIGITRGCIQQLSRDELQGVIAHEFSHIHFGDMRLNLRLVALLHGILVIGLLGYFIMRSAGFSRRRNAGAQVLLGLALIIIGYCGTFFGNLIKAAVSRQREFLADASAVQFTRNPAGIAGALKKIGGWANGSKLSDSHAAEFSHLYFSNGVSQALGSALATHPPLEERIRRIEPSWSGELTRGAHTTTERAAGQPHSQASAAASSFASGFAEEHIGNIGPADLATAQQVLNALPEALKSAAHEPYSARAIIYALLLDTDSRQRAQQLEHLRENAHPATFRVIESIAADVSRLPRTLHLPLIELAIPALKQLSKPQFAVFRANLSALIRSDQKVSLFEWTLYRIILRNLDKAPSVHRTHLRTQHENCQILLSIVCYSGRNAEPSKAFREGAQALELPSRYGLMGPADISFARVDKALDALAGTVPLEKPRLLKALMQCINADGKITAAEAELFRAIADSLDCPVPPLAADSV